MPRRTPTTQNAEKTETQGPPPDPTQALSAAIAAFDEGFKDLKLQGKISTISGFLGRIPKNGWNNYNKYNYVLESDLVEHIRYWLAAARILIYQSVKDWRVAETAVRDNRAGDPRTDILFTFTVVDGYSGESFSFDMLGQGSDPRDKGANKASTSAMKFAYLRLFNIASGEDAENDEQGDQQADLAASAPVVPMQRQQAPTVAASTAEGAQRGGVQATTSAPQLRAISNLSNANHLGATGLVGVIKKVLGDDIELPDDAKAASKVLSGYLAKASGEDAGKLIQALQEMAKAAGQVDDGAGGGYGD